MSEENKNVPPHSVEAEQAVLGSIMLDTTSVEGDRVFDICQAQHITPEWFYEPRNHVVYAAMQELRRTGKPLDYVSITEQLKATSRLETIGGAQYLQSLIDQTPTTAHAEYYIYVLHEKYKRREIIARATKMIEQCHNEGDFKYVQDVLGNAEKSLLELDAGGTTMHPFDTGLEESVKKVTEMAASDKRTLRGLPTGFTQLDNKMLGLADSEMIVVAARPSVGKTALAMNIATNVAKRGEPVLVFSLEMSLAQLQERVISSEGGVNLRKLANMYIEDPDARKAEGKKFADAAERLKGVPITVDDEAGVDILDLRARARRAKKRFGIRLVVIDYLQLCTCKTASNINNRQLEVSIISNNVKAMAKELNVPVIVLSQLSREIDKRDKEGEKAKPKLSDLRDSGAIEQDADVVLFINRPQKELHLDKEEAAIDVAKNRNGETGEVAVAFEPAYTRFSDK